MQELLKKARVCPFCKSDHTNKWTWYSQLKDGKWILCHYCNPDVPDLTMSVTVYGNSAEECIERWNGNGTKQEGESDRR